MQIGIFLPTSTPNPSPEAILDSARIADQGGLDSVWVIDRVMFPLIEAYTALAAVSAVTSHVTLGTSVLLGPTRDPILLGAQTASIDVMSGGTHGTGTRRRQPGRGLHRYWQGLSYARAAVGLGHRNDAPHLGR